VLGKGQVAVDKWVRTGSNVVSEADYMEPGGAGHYSFEYEYELKDLFKKYIKDNKLTVDDYNENETINLPDE
jgi:hypothetical protein